MFGLGMSEIIVLVVLGLVLIGPKELPQLARTLGRFLNELKRTTDGIGHELRQQVRFELDKKDHPLTPTAEQKAVDFHLNSEALHGPNEPAHEPEQMELEVQTTTADSSEKTKS